MQAVWRYRRRYILTEVTMSEYTPAHQEQIPRADPNGESRHGSTVNFVRLVASMCLLLHVNNTGSKQKQYHHPNPESRLF